MLRSLKLHPDSCCVAVTSIAVGVVRTGAGLLTLRYAVTGDIAGLRMPAPAVSARADELWKHSCFEAFARAASDTGYFEFNLAPSTQWAAYRFDGYRSGMKHIDAIGAPRIEVQSDEERFVLQATLDLDGLPDLTRDTPWRLGLSAVIEAADGNLSYWALAHPPGRADFHHSDCFALELPAA